MLGKLKTALDIEIALITHQNKSAKLEKLFIIIILIIQLRD